LTFPDGKRYEGKWQDGNYHGHGTYTFGKWYLKLDNQDGIIYHFFSKKDKLEGDEKFFQLLNDDDDVADKIDDVIYTS
jgi:hypothetical protein